MKFIKTYESFSTFDNSLGGEIGRWMESRNRYLSVDLENFSEVKGILNKDCSKFINEMVSTKSEILFRGFNFLGDHKSPIKGVYEVDSQRGRFPKDMRMKFSDRLDDFFEDKFGERLRRNGVFVTKNPYTASNYSEPSTKSYIFFPIGDYKYYWSNDIPDLFTYVENETFYMDFGLDYNELYGDPRESHGYSYGLGNFRFMDKVLPSHVGRNNLVSYIITMKDEFGLVYDDDKSCYIKDGEVIIRNSSGYKDVPYLEWIPEMSKDEFNNQFDENLDRIVNSYKEGDIASVTKQEITFICDKYYLIEEKYYFKILEWLKSLR
jgi:hypothetical protein